MFFNTPVFLGHASYPGCLILSVHPCWSQSRLDTCGGAKSAVLPYPVPNWFTFAVSWCLLFPVQTSSGVTSPKRTRRVFQPQLLCPRVRPPPLVTKLAPCHVNPLRPSMATGGARRAILTRPRRALGLKPQRSLGRCPTTPKGLETVTVSAS